MSTEPEYVFTLVHGTFARGANWCREDSRLSVVLKSIGSRVLTERFDWSGFNTHRARLKAASELAAHLQSTTTKHPKAAHFVIAHSHGGNVVRYALADSNAANRLRGVITLATPFLSSKAQIISQLLLAYIRACVIAAALLSVCILIGVIASTGTVRFFSMPAAINIFLIPALIGVFAIFHRLMLNPLARLVSRIDDGLRARQKALLEQIDAPQVIGLPLLAIAVNRDEAGFILTIARLSNQWLFSMIGSGVGLGILGFIIVPFVLMLSAVLVLGLPWSLALYVVSLFVTFTASPFFVLFYIFTTLLSPQVVRRPVFGEEGFINAWLLDTVQSQKPGDWQPAQSELFRVERTHWKTLRHSLVYERDEIFNTIARWVVGVSSEKSPDAINVSRQRYEIAPIRNLDRVIRPPIFDRGILPEGFFTANQESIFYPDLKSMRTPASGVLITVNEIRDWETGHRQPCPPINVAECDLPVLEGREGPYKWFHSAYYLYPGEIVDGLTTQGWWRLSSDDYRKRIEQELKVV